MKVKFIEDTGSKKKGDVAEYRDSYAELLIRKELAKKFTPRTSTKEEKATKKTK